MSILKYPLDKNLFIEAGAGTGKTFSLEHIVLRILTEQKIPLSKIALLTFTKKAAHELKSRIVAKINALMDAAKKELEGGEKINYKERFYCNLENAKDIDISFLETQVLKLDEAMIGTIHSFCQKIILKYPHICKTGTNLNYVSTSEFQRLYKSRVLLEGVINKLPYDDLETYMDSLFLGNKLFLYGTANKESHPLLKDSIQPLVNQINEEMMENGTLLYDHLIYLVYKNKEELSLHLRSSYEYLIIDEFQDTDVIQWEIFREMCKTNLRLIVVGDPKQSIYKFRGADVENYSRAKKRPELKWTIQSLDQNFRSSPLLVRFFNSLFAKDWFPLEQNVSFPLSPIEYTKLRPGSFTKDSTTLGFLDFEDSYPFYECAAKIILEESLFQKGSVAILSPGNEELKKVGSILSKYGIPWKFKKILWSESREVQETIYLLDGILDSEESYKICLTRFWKYRPELANSLLLEKESIQEEIWYRRLISLATQKNWAEFFLVLQTDSYLINRLQEEVDPEKVFYDFQDIWEKMETIAIERSFSTEELRGWIEEEKNNLELTLLNQEDSDESIPRREGESVTLMTIHSSKGLEFSTVFIPPSQEPKNKNKDKWELSHFTYISLEKDPNIQLCHSQDEKVQNQVLYEKKLEFRRLYYVGFTRAKYNLYLGVKSGEKTKEFFPNTVLHQIQKESGLLLEDSNFEKISFYNKDTKFQSTKYVPQKNDQLAIDLSKKTPQLISHVKKGFTKKSFTSLSKKGIELPGFELENESYEEEFSEELEIPAQTKMIDSLRGSKFGTVVHSLFEKLQFSTLLESKDIADFRSQPSEYGIFIREIQKLGEYSRQKDSRNQMEEEIFHLLKTALGKNLSEVQTQLGSLPNTQCLREEDFFLWMADDTSQKGNFRKGYLNGSIDLIFEHNKKYYIVDWKSNYLGEDPKTIQKTMEVKMGSKAEGASYGLQAEIYQLALYNFLKSRKIADPLSKLGGAFFMFVRHNVYTYIKPPDLKGIENIEKEISSKLLGVEYGNQ